MSQKLIFLHVYHFLLKTCMADNGTSLISSLAFGRCSFCFSVKVWLWLFVTPWIAAHQASLSFIISWSLLKFMSIELVVPSNHLILSCLLVLSIFPSIRVFSSELAVCSRWPRYWSFSISLSNEYSELISFRTDWFDLLVVQGTHKSLLQHHSLKAILQCSAFHVGICKDNHLIWIQILSPFSFHKTWKFSVKSSPQVSGW